MRIPMGLIIPCRVCCAANRQVTLRSAQYRIARRSDTPNRLGDARSYDATMVFILL